MNKLTKVILLICCLPMIAAAAEKNEKNEKADEPDKPAGAKQPKGTIPYDKTLCKTDKGLPAFAFVKLQPQFDKAGCTKPVVAWSFDHGKWTKVNEKQVTCCDPMAEAGMEP